MANVLLNNSYNILGLESSSTEKEILKRSKEIINLIKIDETPEYDLDIGSVKSLRTERSIKDSLQNLSEPKKRIKEYFFWFDIQDSIDEDAISHIRSEDFSKAINVWKEGIKKNNSKSLFYQKNLAILYSILLSDENVNHSYLLESLNLWKELIKSDKFWDSYIKVFKLNDSLGTSSEVIEDFVKKVPKHLSDIYTELSQKSGKNYHSEFTKIFGVKGERIEQDVLNPIYNNINDAVEELESLKLSEDGVVDENEISQVKSLIKKFQDELNKIIDLGLYDDSQTKLIRDRAANAIRKVVLDIYNNLRETDKSLALLNIALNICGTSSLIHKMEQDIKTLEKNKKDDEIVQPILDLIKEEKYEEALSQIEKDEKENSSNRDLQEFYINHKKMCVSVVSAKVVAEARKNVENGKYDEGKEKYEEVIDLIENNLVLFNVDKEGLTGYIDHIKSMIPKVNINNINQVDDFRNETFAMIDKNFEGQYEAYTLKFLMDAYIFSLLTDFYKNAKGKATVANILYWVAFFVFFWQWWLGLLIAGGAWYYKNKG